VLPNGGLNLSILDGWWSEGYQAEAGWAIGKGEEYQDHVYQDQVESSALYDLLEKDIVPLYYSRGVDGLPRPWIARMRKSLKLTPTFSTNRMLYEYGEHFYRPAASYHTRLGASNFQRARGLAAWKSFVQQHWGEVRVESAEAAQPGGRAVGQGFEVRASVRLGAIDPKDVCVEIYFGPLDPQGLIQEGQCVGMALESTREPGAHRYLGTIDCERTGMLGWTVRIRPCHPDANNLFSTGLLTWR
jgi:starch phosphorylase